MVEPTLQALGLPGIGGQSNAAQLPFAHVRPAGSVEANFRSLLDSQLEEADLQTERREGTTGWNSTFGAQGTPSPTAGQTEQEKVHEAATQLEALLVNILLKQMWANVDEGTLFGQDMGSQFYREMWLDEMSQNIAENQSLGIAGMVEQQLSANLARTVTAEQLRKLDEAGGAPGIALNPATGGNGFALLNDAAPGFDLLPVE